MSDPRRLSYWFAWLSVTFAILAGCGGLVFSWWLGPDVGLAVTLTACAVCGLIAAGLS